MKADDDVHRPRRIGLRPCDACRANAADHPRGEIPLDAIDRCGHRGLEEPSFELLAMGASLTQLPVAVIHSPAAIAAA
jgi:hypothetical protein